MLQSDIAEMNNIESDVAIAPSFSRVLGRHKLFIGIAGILGIAIGMGAATMIPKQWPATLLLQIGQVGSSGNLLVDPYNVVQRIKFSGFSDQVLQAQNLPIDEALNEHSALIKKSLSASITKGGNLVEMGVRGYSPEEAKENMLTAFRILQAEHAMLLLPSVTRLKNNLADARASLQKIEDERTAILGPINKISSSTTIERKFSESILLTSMMKSSDSEIRSFRDQINIYDEQLSPYRTFNTKIIANVYVPQRPVYPRKSVAAVIGLLLGILLSGTWLLLINKEFQIAIRNQL